MYQHNKCAIHWPSPHLNISLISENGDGSVCERRKLVSSFSYISSSGRILESKKRHFSTLQKDNSLNNSTISWYTYCSSPSLSFGFRVQNKWFRATRLPSSLKNPYIFSRAAFFCSYVYSSYKHIIKCIIRSHFSYFHF